MGSTDAGQGSNAGGKDEKPAQTWGYWSVFTFRPSNRDIRTNEILPSTSLALNLLCNLTPVLVRDVKASPGSVSDQRWLVPPMSLSTV